jgi:hypothetical protein
MMKLGLRLDFETGANLEAALYLGYTGSASTRRHTAMKVDNTKTHKRRAEARTKTAQRQ